jgi:hypothetical protein
MSTVATGTSETLDCFDTCVAVPARPVAVPCRSSTFNTCIVPGQPISVGRLQCSPEAAQTSWRKHLALSSTRGRIPASLGGLTQFSPALNVAGSHIQIVTGKTRARRFARSRSCEELTMISGHSQRPPSPFYEKSMGARRRARHKTSLVVQTHERSIR